MSTHLSDKALFAHYKATARHDDWVWFLHFRMSDALRARAKALGPKPSTATMRDLRADWRAERLAEERVALPAAA